MTPGASYHCIQFRPGKLWLVSHLLRDGSEVACFRLSNLPIDLIHECFVSIPGDLGSGLQVSPVVVRSSLTSLRSRCLG